MRFSRSGTDGVDCGVARPQSCNVGNTLGKGVAIFRQVTAQGVNALHALMNPAYRGRGAQRCSPAALTAHRTLVETSSAARQRPRGTSRNRPPIGPNVRL
jgi:hypothetical protein